MTELTAIHPVYTNYEISSTGKVRNISRNKYLNTKVSKSHGFMTARISHRGVVRYTFVHKLVAECFIPEFKKGDRIKFLDGDKTNISLDNMAVKKTAASLVDDPTEAVLLKESGERGSKLMSCVYVSKAIRESGMHNKETLSKIFICGYLKVIGKTKKNEFPKLIPDISKKKTYDYINQLKTEGIIGQEEGFIFLC